MTDELRFDVAGPVATLRFNRPAARNALTVEILVALAERLHQCAADNVLRIVVLRGTGEQPFSAGYNFDELPDRAISVDEARDLHAPVRAVADAILACPHPVIGAARKFVFGAALDIFSHCDLRVCAEGTTFCMPPNRFGFLYPDEGIHRLADIIGLSRVTEMLMLGSTVDTAWAKSWGLVHTAFPEQAFENDLTALCDVVATNAPLSLRGTKRALIGYRRNRQADSDSASAAMYEAIAACLNSDDVREGRAAFREKRSARFQGR